MRNLITDVPGVTVGNAEDAAARTGVTVVLCERAMAAGVDVRGGGPGTRETEALSPENLVGQADAFVFAGGSAYGLGAADGVASALGAMGRGVKLRAEVPGVAIVPAAIIYDLDAHSAAWVEAPPFARLGREALAVAGKGFSLGSHGAGRGAMAGDLKGGLGSASAAIGGGLVVGALAVANPVGSVCMPGSRCFWAWPFEREKEFGGRRPDPDAPLAHAPIPDDWKPAARERRGDASLTGNTAVAAVAVNAALTAGECRRVAIMAQDGIARAIRPSHTPLDGDTVFAVATGMVEIGDGMERVRRLTEIGSAAADCLARAVARGVYEARSAEGEAPAWRDRAGG